jgi:hypothetical protein
MTIPQNFDLKAELKKCKTAEDLTGENGLLGNKGCVQKMDHANSRMENNHLSPFNCLWR